MTRPTNRDHVRARYRLHFGKVPVAIGRDADGWIVGSPQRPHVFAAPTLHLLWASIVRPPEHSLDGR